MNEFELKILDFIQEHVRCGFLDKIVPIITSLGDTGILWIIIAVLLLFIKKYRKTGAMMGVALIIGLLVGNIFLKNIIGRIRPYDMLGLTGEELKAFLLIDPPSEYSFPSGHTLASFEGATVLFINDKRLGIPAIVVAVLISLSRLYLYVHYPTDVLAGAILGVVNGVLACILVNWVVKTFNDRGLKNN